MTLTVDVTEQAVSTAMNAFLQYASGLDAVHVIRGQKNRIAPPPEPEYIVFTPLKRMGLSTSVETSDPTNGTTDVSRSTQIGYQIDVHGFSSADTSQIITTLFKSSVGVAQFPSGITPLYSTDPEQIAFDTAEMQTENRYTFNVFLQVTPTVSTPAQFADTLALNIVDAVDSGAP